MRNYTGGTRHCQTGVSARALGGVLVAAAIVVSSTADGRAQLTTRGVAIRVDPVATILDAFASRPVVALGEGPHGNVQGHAFRLRRLRDPRFASVVNDIVVESGSATYQDVMDRFVRGEAVPPSALRDIRENTVTATPAWDRPRIDEFLDAVRDRNRSLPPGRRLRILLGDPPIEWSTITTIDEYRTILSRRDAHPADLIRREVLAKGRRALVIYGDGHFAARLERPAQSMAGLLEASGVGLFSIVSTFADLTPFQPDVSAWRAPAMARLCGTRLGTAPLETVLGALPPLDAFTSHPNVEDHYDAVLWLGPQAAMTVAPLAYPRCAEPAYVDMRVGRMLVTGMPANVGERLAEQCAASRPAVRPPPR